MRNGLLALALLCLVQNACPVLAVKQGSSKTLHGSIDQWGILCNAAGIRLAGARVEKVMLGSPAYYSGLRDNDKIIDCEVGDTTLKVKFERKGKQYGVTVPTHPSAIKTSGVVPAVHRKSPISEAQAFDRLKDCDIIVFLDCSGSMGDGIRSEANITKWEWARKHIREFNDRFNQVAHRPITLVTFNDKFEILPNCSMKDLETVFEKRHPEGGTDLAEPLAMVLATRLKNLNKRPCVIAIMHDGITSDESRVEDILKATATANRMLSPAVHVTFLQIGDDAAGADAMKNWDDSDFAGKDMVRAQLFTDIKDEGLARSIADAIEPVATVVIPSAIKKPASKP